MNKEKIYKKNEEKNNFFLKKWNIIFRSIYNVLDLTKRNRNFFFLDENKYPDAFLQISRKSEINC